MLVLSQCQVRTWLIGRRIAVQQDQGINLNPSVYFFTKVSPYVVYTSYGDFLMIEILTDSPYNRDEVGGKQPLL